MTKCVVEVGPVSIRGPCDVDQDLVSTALGCIDDEIALLDEHPVAVPAIWRAVFRSALSDCSGPAVLVCPTWWSSTRVERVQEAASGLAAQVVSLRRAQVLTDGESGAPTVVEIAPEFVVIWRSGRVVVAEPRVGEPTDVVTAVADGVGEASAVLVDAPIDVDGGSSLATAISARLRADGLVVTTVHQNRVLAGMRGQPRPGVREPGPRAPEIENG